jgi:acyl-CoA thioester hydrolase
MTDPTPFLARPMTVRSEWIDYNGHMNMAYYVVAFDLGSDDAFAAMGMGPDYAKQRHMSVYTAETKIRYIRELHEGATLHVSFQMIDHDGKRIHGYQEIRHADGWLAATAEVLWLHIDASGPKVCPFPDDVVAKITAMAQAHAILPQPDGIGRAVAIARKAS